MIHVIRVDVKALNMKPCMKQLISNVWGDTGKKASNRGKGWRDQLLGMKDS